MYNSQNQYPWPYFPNMQMFNMFPYPFWTFPQVPNMNPSSFWGNASMYNQGFQRPLPQLKDYGPNPFVINIENATDQNNNFRTALWTGTDLQVTLMSIDIGDDIGLEVHETGDQFIRIEEGQGLVKMGDSKDKLDFQKMVYEDYAIMIPAGKWHNIINTGNKPLKLYAVYAPPQHPHDTVHQTKADAELAEQSSRY
ncbi:cupin domain-containing protein [Paraclostridium bifermentans]|uniref:cupin domain-containing protein n=1 Tax=Paraclostridium bifermentans TaxID=1490 RepID=UPI0018982868|nr:cupin domain-containing protein [Paraclostridium bifermentans]MDU3336849.1 cupin domain-containing protein [Paraclostridium bifermentans]